MQSFYIAKSKYDLGAFAEAVPIFRSLADHYSYIRDYPNFVDMGCYLVRGYVSMNGKTELKQLSDEMQFLLAQKKISGSSSLHYAIGLSQCVMGQVDAARLSFQASEAYALMPICHEDLSKALIGSLRLNLFNLESSKQYIGEQFSRLESVLGARYFPESSFNLKILIAKLLRNEKKFDEALEMLNSAYYDLRNIKSLFYSALLMGNIGGTYLEAQRLELAGTFLNIAAQSVDRESHCRLAVEIDATLRNLEGLEKLQKHGPTGEVSDLVIYRDQQVVVEKTNGKIDFKSQFVPFELLNMLAENPGQAVGKEEIVTKLWRHPYSPPTSDNKLYVTIKRLRDLIEPNPKKITYIVRSKDGYLLNSHSTIEWK